MYKLQTGVKFAEGIDLRKQMVEAGKRDGTAEERLDKYYRYVNGQQNELLKQSIEERKLDNEGILVAGLLELVNSE